MIDTRFDALAKVMAAASGTRRHAVGVGIASAVLGALKVADGAAKKKKGKRKRKKCAKAGQQTSKKRKTCCKGLLKDATGRCARRPRDCTPGSCPANEICLRSGECQPCTVTCTGTPGECGAELQTAMDGGGTVYVCPGIYQGGFDLNNSVTVIGAGEGTDAARNTVLDAAGAFSVLEVRSGAGPVALERLHVTGGTGSGIRHQGAKLQMTDCTVSGNGGLNAFGAGIYADGTLEMTRCTVRDNHATGQYGSGAGLAITGGISDPTTLTDCLIEVNDATSGGGIVIAGPATTTLAGTQVRGNLAFHGGGIYIGYPGATLAIAEDCRVTENVAPSGHGGGIYLTDGAVALLGADPSPIVVNNCHENCAPDGDVPKCAATPVSC